jgi:hypothetical protein
VNLLPPFWWFVGLSFLILTSRVEFWVEEVLGLLLLCIILKRSCSMFEVMED